MKKGDRVLTANDHRATIYKMKEDGKLADLILDSDPDTVQSNYFVKYLKVLDEKSLLVEPLRLLRNDLSDAVDTIKESCESQLEVWNQEPAIMIETRRIQNQLESLVSKVQELENCCVPCSS